MERAGRTRPHLGQLTTTVTTGALQVPVLRRKHKHYRGWQELPQLSLPLLPHALHTRCLDRPPAASCIRHRVPPRASAFSTAVPSPPDRPPLTLPIPTPTPSSEDPTTQAALGTVPPPTSPSQWGQFQEPNQAVLGDPGASETHGHEGGVLGARTPIPAGTVLVAAPEPAAALPSWICKEHRMHLVAAKLFSSGVEVSSVTVHAEPEGSN